MALDLLAKETRDLLEAERLTWRLPFATGSQHRERVFGTPGRAELDRLFAEFDEAQPELELHDAGGAESAVHRFPDRSTSKGRSVTSSWKTTEKALDSLDSAAAGHARSRRITGSPSDGAGSEVNRHGAS